MAESFGTITGPSSAPFKASANVLRFRPFVASAALWHIPHLVAKMGPTSDHVTDVEAPPVVVGAGVGDGARVGVGGNGVGV